jgi:CheY-like chemotaxis protein
MSRTIVVLVVEDETLIRMDIAATIAEAGFRVLEANAAADAVQLLEQHSNVHVLFTDVEMPGGMDGVALAHHARARSPTIRIIITSGRRMLEEKDLPPATVFVPKPYRHAHIVEKLKDMVA